MSDESREQIEQMINAVGALCELAGLLRKELIKQGFTKAESFKIVEQFMIGHLNKQ